MAENKKEWVTPELIVLVRSKPEEAVLTGCKSFSAGSGDPGTNYAQCYEGCCFGCESTATS